MVFVVNASYSTEAKSRDTSGCKPRGIFLLCLWFRAIVQNDIQVRICQNLRQEGIVDIMEHDFYNDHDLLSKSASNFRESFWNREFDDVIGDIWKLCDARISSAVFFKDKRESTLVSIHVHPTELFKSLVMTDIGFIYHNSPENQALVDLF